VLCEVGYECILLDGRFAAAAAGLCQRRVYCCSACLHACTWHQAALRSTEPRLVLCKESRTLHVLLLSQRTHDLKRTALFHCAFSLAICACHLVVPGMCCCTWLLALQCTGIKELSTHFGCCTTGTSPVFEPMTGSSTCIATGSKSWIPGSLWFTGKTLDQQGLKYACWCSLLVLLLMLSFETDGICDAAPLQQQTHNTLVGFVLWCHAGTTRGVEWTSACWKRERRCAVLLLALDHMCAAPLSFVAETLH
jgi:hypothetical protein